MLRLLRRLLVLALLGAAVAAAVRARQGRRAVAPAPNAGLSWPPLSAVDPSSSTAASALVEPAVVEAAVEEAEEEESSGAWVKPVDGACPDGYPVKANRSGIFHVPGGQFYDRTVPERCYADRQAAEADGYRAARR